MHSCVAPTRAGGFDPNATITATHWTYEVVRDESLSNRKQLFAES